MAGGWLGGLRHLGRDDNPFYGSFIVSSSLIVLRCYTAIINLSAAWRGVAAIGTWYSARLARLASIMTIAMRCARMKNGPSSPESGPCGEERLSRGSEGNSGRACGQCQGRGHISHFSGKFQSPRRRSDVNRRTGRRGVSREGCGSRILESGGSPMAGLERRWSRGWSPSRHGPVILVLPAGRLRRAAQGRPFFMPRD